QLLLDATLGFINIQQNDLFKILTIVSVVGVPPTILVGIWGMNFKNMPELNWLLGYPLAWLAVIASGLLPLLWFKHSGWFEYEKSRLCCPRACDAWRMIPKSGYRFSGKIMLKQ